MFLQLVLLLMPTLGWVAWLGLILSFQHLNIRKFRIMSVLYVQRETWVQVTYRRIAGVATCDSAKRKKNFFEELKAWHTATSEIFLCPVCHKCTPSSFYLSFYCGNNNAVFFFFVHSECFCWCIEGDEAGGFHCQYCRLFIYIYNFCSKENFIYLHCLCLIYVLVIYD